MDSMNELINDPQLSSLEKDLTAVKLNDYHFSDGEKRKAKLLMEERMQAYDRRHHWRQLAWAAVITLCVAGLGVTMWHFSQATKDNAVQTARIVPRNLDMVLTTTDGHSLTLSEGGQLVCSELGYLTIKGVGQTLTCTPSATTPTPKAAAQLCELRVPEGKRTQIELSDGSRVWVNSATTVRFPISFEGDERHIIVDGEVYLEVAHKSECPFVVEAGGLSVKVLGTKFGVTAYSGQCSARVVLAEGRVDVETGDTARYNLQPGQMLELDNGIAQLADTEAYTYTSWKDGLLYFDGTPLSEALSRLSKQYAVDITCSPASAHLRLYGKLILEDDVADVLDNLTVIEPITYQVRNNQVLVEEIEKLRQ